MMRTPAWSISLCAAAVAAFAGSSYDSGTPLTEPKLFAEGVISTQFDEFGLGFTRDGETVLFNRSAPRSNLYTILTSTYTNGHWTDPAVAPFSGRYWDFDAVFSPDGSKVFFGSDRPAPGRVKADKDFDIWMVQRSGKGWTEPQRLDDTVNSDQDETFASVSANGTLYFVSGREGGRDHLAIYRSRLINSKYAPAEKLRGAVNDQENWSLEVLIAPDESFLLLVPFGRKDGYGSFDIYVSEQKDGAWSEPRNLGPKVNTAARDYSPRFSPDGRYLFWSSERGFGTDKQTKPLEYGDFERHTRDVLSGWGNIYQIDLSVIGLKVAR